MRLLKIIILNIFIFSSCDQVQRNDDFGLTKNKTIPFVEKEINDTHFELINGVLFFDKKAYSGRVNELYPEGKLRTTSIYYQGKRQGAFNGWYANGTKWFERFYTNGLKSGSHIGWFNNGQKMFEYQFNDIGMYHGSVKDWHQNGILAKHFNFYKGKEDGSQKMWEMDGKIRANFFTVNGERHGLIGLKNCVSVLTEENDI